MFNIDAEIKAEIHDNKIYNILRGFRNGELVTIQCLSFNEIETLEIQLTNILTKLYAYRKTTQEPIGYTL